MVAVAKTPPRRKIPRLVVPIALFVIAGIVAVLESASILLRGPMATTGLTEKPQANEEIPQTTPSTGTRTVHAHLPFNYTDKTEKTGTSKEVRSTNITYSLSNFAVSSAKEAYERGFWQHMGPVSMDRWEPAANTTCLPLHSQSLPKWKRHVPYVIMIGAQKGGTTALSYYLYNHPSIEYIPLKELRFFDEELDRNPALISKGSGINASLLLDFYQERVIGGIVPIQDLESGVKYVLDATPNYLFLSDRVPQRILCTSPWVKLLATLRDPVDRAYSQYQMQLYHDISNPDDRRGFVSFEDYISLDMKVLQDTGVLPKGYGGWHAVDADTNVLKDFNAATLLSEEVLESWSTYTKLGLNSPVGRGLYSIHLSQWFRAMDAAGKPRSDLMVVSSRRLLTETNTTYTEIIDFLGLTPHSMTHFGKIHVSKYQATKMQPEIQRKLQDFYEPFNRQVDVLLSGFNNWGGI